MIGVWLIAAVFVCGVVVYGLTLRTPGWFRTDARDAAEQRRVAQRLENRIITEAYRFRGEPVTGADGIRRTGEEWNLRITEEESTAWLGVKLAEWLANRDPPVRLPQGLADLQTHFAGGRAWVAGRIDDNVYTLSAGVIAGEAGVWLSRVRAGVGSLALPVSWGGFGLVGSAGPERAGSGEWAWRVVSGQDPILKDATLRLEDGRQVRVLRVRLVPGAIEVGCRTEAR